MKIIQKLNIINFVYIFGGIILAGVCISGLITSDVRWMNWHYSRLGEGGQMSAIIFNIAIFMSAMVIYLLSRELGADIIKLPNLSETARLKAVKLIRRLFQAISICLVCVAVFPFDVFPTVHDIFGYSMLLLFLSLCWFMPIILPKLSTRLYTYGKFIIFSTIFCYILFGVYKLITLLIVETIVFTLLYIWLIFFVKEVNSKIYHKNDK